MNIYFILFLLCVFTSLVSILMFVRNLWVFNQRERLLAEDREAYRKLPTYEQMMLKFWIWDIKKFLP